MQTEYEKTIVCKTEDGKKTLRGGEAILRHLGALPVSEYTRKELLEMKPEIPQGILDQLQIRRDEPDFVLYWVFPPDVARKVVDHYHGNNRKISAVTTKEIEKAILKDLFFIDSSDALRFTVEGPLDDGQNRLTGAANSGKTVVLPCVFNVPTWHLGAQVGKRRDTVEQFICRILAPQLKQDLGGDGRIYQFVSALRVAFHPFRPRRSEVIADAYRSVELAQALIREFAQAICNLPRVKARRSPFGKAVITFPFFLASYTMDTELLLGSSRTLVDLNNCAVPYRPIAAFRGYAMPLLSSQSAEAEDISLKVMMNLLWALNAVHEGNTKWVPNLKFSGTIVEARAWGIPFKWPKKLLDLVPELQVC